MKRALLLFAVVAAIVLPARADEIGAFTPGRCLIPIPLLTEVTCGYVTVPARHEQPDGATMRLAVAIVRASGGSPRPDPVLYLEGGPGGSALASIDVWTDSPLRFDRDLILLDQRGTGRSQPALVCAEYGIHPESYNALLFHRACAQAMSTAGVDLGAFNSAQSAQDIVLVAHALGYQQVNLLGISYGTRVAMTVLRDRPEIVRAAVLDSPYPPHVNGMEQQVVNAYDAIDGVLTACGQDAACDAAFPGLRARFYQWVESGDRVETDLGFGEGSFGPAGILPELFTILYGTEEIPYVPQALHSVVDGDGKPFADLASGSHSTSIADLFRYIDLLNRAEDIAASHVGRAGGVPSILSRLSAAERIALFDAALAKLSEDAYIELVRLHLELETDDKAASVLRSLDDRRAARLYDNIVNSLAINIWSEFGADGLFNVVMCAEELPFNSMRDGDQLSMRVPPIIRVSLMTAVYAQYRACRGWAVDPAGSLESEVVRSDTPALVLAGQFDPITPPSFADAAVEGLTRAVKVVIPGGGHGVTGEGTCPDALILAFLDDPEAPLNTACAQGLTVRWVTE